MKAVALTPSRRLATRSVVPLRYVQPDHLGSTTTLTDPNGNVVAKERYSAFGERRRGESPLITDQLYTGQRYNALSSLYHYSDGKSAGRFYDPLLGRFVSADSVTPPGSQGLNRYAYGLNNPVKYTDPNGHCPAMPGGYSGICFALFIKPDRISAGPFSLHGDGRDFEYGSDPDASRAYLWINLDQNSFDPHANPSGYIWQTLDWTGAVIDERIEWFKPSDQNRWDVQFGDDGSVTVTYDLVLSGYLENAAAHINGTIVFKPDGKGGYTSSGNRDGFPWGEAYYRDVDGRIRTVFQRPAVRGDPYDLSAIEKPVPFWNLPYHGRNVIQSIQQLWPWNNPPQSDAWEAER